MSKNKKFRLYNKAFEVWKNNWYLIPTIQLIFNDLMYHGRNVSVEFHWLCFHGRLMWVEGDKYWI